MKAPQSTTWVSDTPLSRKALRPQRMFGTPFAPIRAAQASGVASRLAASSARRARWSRSVGTSISILCSSRSRPGTSPMGALAPFELSSAEADRKTEVSALRHTGSGVCPDRRPCEAGATPSGSCPARCLAGSGGPRSPACYRPGRRRPGTHSKPRANRRGKRMDAATPLPRDPAREARRRLCGRESPTLP
jgi:hypothetical protein